MPPWPSCRRSWKSARRRPHRSGGGPSSACGSVLVLMAGGPRPAPLPSVFCPPLSIYASGAEDARRMPGPRSGVADVEGGVEAVDHLAVGEHRADVVQLVAVAVAAGAADQGVARAVDAAVERVVAVL